MIFSCARATVSDWDCLGRVAGENCYAFHDLAASVFPTTYRRKQVPSNVAILPQWGYRVLGTAAQLFSSTIGRANEIDSTSSSQVLGDVTSPTVVQPAIPGGVISAE